MKPEITSAFGHRLLPATVTTVAENSTLRDDALHLQGMVWKEVTSDDWREYSDAFFGLSPEAFLYFLPSLLLVSLEQPLVAADALISSLDTSANPDIWDDWFAERFQKLTLAEVRVLKVWAAAYLAEAAKGEGSEFARVQETLAMLELSLEI